MKLLILTILLIGCAKHKVQPVSDLLPELQNKADIYQALGKDVLDEDGWILTTHCDALLHSSLATLGGAVTHDRLLQARAANGQWYRRPAMDCLKKKESKSTISRDMLLGLLISIAVSKDVDSIVKLYDYAVENNYVMGQSDGSVDGINRVLLTPPMFIMLKSVKDYLENGIQFSLVKSDEVTGLELRDFDYTDHLKLLSIMLRSIVGEKISALDLYTLKSLTEADPNNALAWALRTRFDPDMNGDASIAVNILLRPDLFPNERLPTSRDRSSEYLWMHGENEKDWLPSTGPEVTHPGHDLTLAAWIILHE